jgi:hypothetical protein
MTHNAQLSYFRFSPFRVRLCIGIRCCRCQYPSMHRCPTPTTRRLHGNGCNDGIVTYRNGVTVLSDHMERMLYTVWCMVGRHIYWTNVLYSNIEWFMRIERCADNEQRMGRGRHLVRRVYCRDTDMRTQVCYIYS